MEVNENYGKIVHLVMVHNNLESTKSFDLSKLEGPEYDEIKDDLQKLILKVYAAYFEIWLNSDSETRSLAAECGFYPKQYAIRKIRTEVLKNE